MARKNSEHVNPHDMLLYLVSEPQEPILRCWLRTPLVAQYLHQHRSVHMNHGRVMGMGWEQHKMMDH